jgi:ATP/maltotriose-dependent transcriptional regulator MalT
MSARERAYRGYRDAGDPCGAARMAMWLGTDTLDFRGDDAVAEAWLRRARSLVEDRSSCSEQGWIALLEADIALLARSDPMGAERHARAELEVALEVGDVDVEVIALAILGSAMVAAGQVAEGLRKLEESAALAVGEDFSEAAAPGWALCHTVAVCADVGDFARAAQWCRAMHRLSTTWRARHFFGICRVAYGEVLSTRGDWPSAEQELVSARDDLRATRPGLAAPSAVRLGELRVRQGDRAAARALFEEALPSGPAIVALGELALAEGDVDAATNAAERALRRLGESSLLERVPALELLARARAAAGDEIAAAATTHELERDVERLGTPYLRGRGRWVRASVLLAAGEHDAARKAAEDAADLFAASSAPYEEARARMALSAALKGLGHRDRAEAEASAARATFAMLGARPELPAGGTEELSPREVDILRLVSEGLSDARIAERLFLSPHTVHRHVANIRAKLRVPSRAAAAADAARRGLL